MLLRCSYGYCIELDALVLVNITNFVYDDIFVYLLLETPTLSQYWWDIDLCILYFVFKQET